MADPVPVPVGDILARQNAGMGDAAARADAYAAAVARAATQADVLRKALQSPAWSNWSQQLQRQLDLTQRLTAAARNHQLAASIQNGQALQQVQAVTALNRQYDLMQLKLQNQARAADLASGAFRRHAAALAQANRESAALARQEQMEQLVAERGRFGAFRQAAAPHLQTLGMFAGMGSAMTMGMVRSGFTDTAEWARFTYQWERLQRQLAAIAIPVFERIGGVVSRVAAYFEGLTGRQQDQWMKAGLVAIGLVTLGGVVKMASVALGAFAGVARAAASTLAASSAVGGVGAAGAGLAGGLAMGGLLTAAAGLAAGGALASVEDPALGFGARAGGLGALTSAALLSRAGVGGAAARVGGRLLAPVAVGMTAMDAFEGYGRASRGGASEPMALFGGILHGLTKFATFGLVDLIKDTPAKKAEEAEKARRDPSAMGTGLLDVGGTAQIIQEQLLRASAARDEGDAEGRAALGVIKDAALKMLYEMEMARGHRESAAEILRRIRER